MSSVRHSVRFPAFHTTRRLPWSSALFSRGLKAITGQERTRIYLRGQLRVIRQGGMWGTLRSWLGAPLMLCQCLVAALACAMTHWLLISYAESVGRSLMKQQARG